MCAVGHMMYIPSKKRKIPPLQSDMHTYIFAQVYRNIHIYCIFIPLHDFIQMMDTVDTTELVTKFLIKSKKC